MTNVDQVNIEAGNFPIFVLLKCSNMFRNLVILCTLLILSKASVLSQKKDGNNSTSYFFDKLATTWHEPIPIGNGSLGGMVYGGLISDTIK